MPDFAAAFESTLRREGGYVLHTVKGDRGGMTYAGIARAAHPEWIGWQEIDTGGQPEAAVVRNLYRVRYWDAVRGNDLPDTIAPVVFDTAVNCGVKTAIKLAQITVGATPDGVIGPKTLAAIQAADPALFLAQYALARIARYAGIVTKDKSQSKFLLGWINRVLA